MTSRYVSDGKDALPPAGELKMTIQDTVRYFSNDGDITLEFQGDSPFRDKNGNKMTKITGPKKTGSPPLTLQSEGKFMCGCFITLPSGKRVGWDPKTNPGSGTVHDVGH
ncbi:MAG: hypothetical protein DMG96_41030 [Acidobacteria bacterium]|nr:MAG: hypothetical protein DMG96_41030 [Acidobacteriota bacterium]